MSNVTWKQIDDLQEIRPVRERFSNEENYNDALDRHARRANELLEVIEEELRETTLGRQKIVLEKYTSDISDEIYKRYE